MKKSHNLDSIYVNKLLTYSKHWKKSVYNVSKDVGFYCNQTIGNSGADALKISGLLARSLDS